MRPREGKYAGKPTSEIEAQESLWKEGYMCLKASHAHQQASHGTCNGEYSNFFNVIFFIFYTKRPFVQTMYKCLGQEAGDRGKKNLEEKKNGEYRKGGHFQNSPVKLRCQKVSSSPSPFG